jgi:hypothetical protein
VTSLATWRRQIESNRRIVIIGAAVLALICSLLVTWSFGSAIADTNPSAGADVPADQLQMINAAAASCPVLTPARLAGQVMANSGFTSTAKENGRSGIAGLTDDAWKRWAPRPGADRNSARDNIDALAHAMCDLVGELRSRQIGGDLWRLSLASFTAGVPSVTKAGGVPTGAAANYVAAVDSYTNWYAQQRAFGGSGTVSASASPTPLAGARPVPEAYLQPVLAAGTVCPAVTPARIAAQLMAQSGFNPNKLSSVGQAGIAQFRQQTWATYNLTPLATPWEAPGAILVLGRAMCDLVSQVSKAEPQADAWAAALSAFEWGVTSVAQAGAPTDANRTFAAQVNSYVAYYSADPRLSAKATIDPTTTPSTSSAPASRPATPTPTNPSVTDGPPVPGTRSAYGTIQAESYSGHSAIQLENCVDTGGGQDVGYLGLEDWLEYSKVDFGSAGATKFFVRFASDLPSGMSGLIEVRIDSRSAAPVGSAAVGRTGGWQNWITVPANTTKVTGVHTVYLTFFSSSQWEIGNINWFTFQH